MWLNSFNLYPTNNKQTHWNKIISSARQQEVGSKRRINRKLKGATGLRRGVRLQRRRRTNTGWQWQTPDSNTMQNIHQSSGLPHPIVTYRLLWHVKAYNHLRTFGFNFFFFASECHILIVLLLGALLIFWLKAFRATHGLIWEVGPPLPLDLLVLHFTVHKTSSRESG